MFSVLENRAVIAYEIRTRSDLHIGSRSSTSPADVDMPVLKGMDGTPVIPGSSLKGVLRTEMERLLRGMDINVCTVPEVCGKVKGFCIEDTCPVCRLFGGMALSSSVRVQDARADSKRTMVRDGVGIDRKTRKALRGVKYDIEVVPAGSRFAGTITVENLSLDGHADAKLGGLISLIEFFNACSGSIGHGTSRGFGQVEISPVSVAILTAQDYLDGNYRGSIHDVPSDGYEELRKRSVEAWQEYLRER